MLSDRLQNSTPDFMLGFTPLDHLPTNYKEHDLPCAIFQYI